MTVTPVHALHAPVSIKVCRYVTLYGLARDTPNYPHTEGHHVASAHEHKGYLAQSQQLRPVSRTGPNVECTNNKKLEHDLVRFLKYSTRNAVCVSACVSVSMFLFGSICLYKPLV